MALPGPISGIVQTRPMTRRKRWRKWVSTSFLAGIRCPGSGARLRSLRDSHTRRLHASRISPRRFSLITPSATIGGPLLVFFGKGMLTGRLPVTTWRQRALQRGSYTPMPPQTKPLLRSWRPLYPRNFVLNVRSRKLESLEPLRHLLGYCSAMCGVMKVIAEEFLVMNSLGLLYLANPAIIRSTEIFFRGMPSIFLTR